MPRVAASDTTVRAGRRNVRISHPDKVLFPADGITKADLADHYLAVAPAMVPLVRDRPLNLWRWNAGIDKPVVVQQAIPKGAPDWIKRIEVPRRKGGDIVHAVGGETATLVWLANQNCITPHCWTSRADRPGLPDRLVFDLDGLVPFAMTSGSRGIHVVAPLRRRAHADEARATAGTIAERLAERRPDELTTAWRKEKRGGRVLVDVARNTYAQTTVAPYAVRALPGAPVATPLAWDELEDPGLHPRRWTLADVPARLAERGCPWADIGRDAKALPVL
jgi:bifunctional non-homologous end joining protein LigD